VSSLEQQAPAEAAYASAVAAGNFSTAWVDDALRSAGIEAAP
jgi:hypothetical protein